MKRIKMKKESKRTIFKYLIIVFFCVLINSLLLFKIYTNKTMTKINTLTDSLLNDIIYDFFNDLITDKVINKNSVNDILKITKNAEGDILAVSYDLEKTYAILTKVTNILEKGINDLENGQINLKYNNKYLQVKHHNLILNIPFFISSNNIFLNNLGPFIPVGINLNETLLTNIKTKVTDYGFNNALLEIYITVELNKLIITPLNNENSKLNYDILVSSLVVNGSVPKFYGDSLEVNSTYLYLPKKI